MFQVLFVAGSAGQSCIESSYGTEYVFGFVNLKSYSFHNPVSPDLHLRFLSDRTTSIEIGIPERSSPTMETRHITSYRYKEMAFNSTFINDKDNTSIGGAITIKSSTPVSLLAKYDVGLYTVSSPIYPVNLLGQYYIIPSFEPNTLSHSNTEILVIAINDSTHFNINGYAMSRSIYAVLDKLQTYTYSANRDLSSAVVRSDHPVAVFCTYNMGDLSYNDASSYHQPMTVQLLPADDSAVHFIVPAITISSSIDYYMIRIFAAEEGAHIQIYTSSSNVKNVHVFSGIYYEMQTGSSYSLEIFSDRPIQVFQMPKSKSYSPGLFMVQIPAISQYMTSYLPISADDSKYIVVIPEDEATGLLVDDKPVVHNVDSIANRTPLGNFTVLSIDGHTHSQVSHIGNVKFGLFVYSKSVNQLFSFGYAAGINFNNSDCSNTPGFNPAIIG
ncbi:hypothetical protein ACF0H5_010808 [Mactra antiquata]